MSNRESYIFWRLAYSFISEHGYRIIQLFENQKELWLEKVENKQAPIIRMLRHDLDWSNAMQRDIEYTAANGERVRKQIGRSELNVVNIYISQFPPVDEYQYRIANPFVYPEGNKTTVSSILFAKGEFDTGFGRISERLGKEIYFSFAEDYSEQDVEAIKKESLDFANKKVKTERAILSNGKPFFTYVFIAIQAIVFFWLEFHGGSTNTSTLIKYGAKVNQLILGGEWWRFITPIFLHIGFVHLAMNTLALYFLGTTVEKIFGSVRFLLIYLFAGVMGVIASFIFSSTLSAGASGAIYGCFGALLYFGVIYPKLFSRTMGMNLIIVLGINLVFSFSASGIDVAGHLGGLAGGFLAAGIVHFPKKKKLGWQLLFSFASAAIVWGAITYGYSPSAKSNDENAHLLMAQEYIKQDNYDQAYKVLKESEEKVDKLSEKTYFLLSFVEIKKEMLADAKGHLQKAIQLDPEFDEAYYNLALINLEQNDIKQAKVNADKAAKLEPKQKQYSDLVREIDQHLQSIGEG
ncbi:serine protease of Rhomboid family, contains TPR repeats [Neobacillus bataviensis LMG 21833]|uniref:Serine protease of Rhomboid family, contains TPR repeats n=1 Tax=Neobacillus bataviensis LMG 21833 TaxID=1117379 RepID=K6D1A0_9BACI|nr:rhomboid family intramembrane serine protease [Neobacillus bataviensis]EKN66272.1 serine protease of Rhomboid family, contains TPR repeats [Neobacillus bataviensis LMG 21833]